jgi:hypothetical protein
MLSPSSLARVASIFVLGSPLFSQNPPAPPKEVAGIPANYDESKVGTYTLPDPLLLPNGKQVKDAKTWYKQRRPQIVHLFEENQFGKSPAAPNSLCLKSKTCGIENVWTLQLKYGDGNAETARKTRGALVPGGVTNGTGSPFLQTSQRSSGQGWL